jgi:carbamoyl-phosphate synthase/aspartate carbamoyltransferase
MVSTKPAFEGAVPSSNIPASEQAVSLAPANHSVVISDVTPPSSPRPGSITSPAGRPIIQRSLPSYSAPPKPFGGLYPPATLKGIDATGPGAEDWEDSMGEADAVLELADGLALAGHSFGAKKSIAGECVFQTGETGKILILILQEWLDIPSLLPTLHTLPRF